MIYTDMKHKANKLPFGKFNYQLLLIGILVIVTGFTLIALDKEEYGFGVLGLTIGPITVMLGFIIEFFAIMLTSSSPSKGRVTYQSDQKKARWSYSAWIDYLAD